MKLSQLSAPMVREFEDKLARGDMPNGAEPQPRTRAMVRKVRVSLSSLLSDAQERGLVSRNVVRELRETRTRGKERKAERRQKGKLKVGVDIPTREEIKAIVEAAKGRWRPIFLTAIFTGLRASELRGLRWADVDLDKRELHVRQRADRYSAIGKPKSESGERTVPLTPIVVNTLREWKLACPKSEAGLVFPSTRRPASSTTRISSSVGLSRRSLLLASSIDGGRDRETASRSSGPNTQACTLYGTSMPHGASTAASTAAWSCRRRSFRSAWPLVDHDDDGRLRASVPAGRRFGSSSRPQERSLLA